MKKNNSRKNVIPSEQAPLAQLISFRDAAKAAAERARLEEEAQKYLGGLRLHCRRLLAAGTTPTLEFARTLADFKSALDRARDSLKEALSPVDRLDLDADHFRALLRAMDDPRPGWEACAKLLRQGVFNDAAKGNAAARKAIAEEETRPRLVLPEGKTVENAASATRGFPVAEVFTPSQPARILRLVPLDEEARQ